MKSMKLFLSLSKVLTKKVKIFFDPQLQARPKDMITEFPGIAGGKTFGVDFHKGRLGEEAIGAVLIKT